MQHFGKGALRVAKNYTKGYSDTQAKVRDATSNDPWGPSGTQMNELAQMTYNQGDFVEIMEMLDKRLNDKGKNWRHVFKSLTVLDYLLHAGSENVVIYFKDNIYIIKTLKEFQFVDEDGKDQGANVRQKAKDITNLLQDESRLREERRTRASMRDRMIRGRNEDDPDGEYDPPAGLPPPSASSNLNKRGRGRDRDEEELRKAIEESKKSLAAEQERHAQTKEDQELEQAIKLSEEEEKNRHKALEDTNANSLFDDQQQLPTPQGQSNNPFPLLDPTPYAVGLQPQYTVQPQFTSFNPYHNQAEQEAAQAEFFRQQQMWQQQQQAEMMRQQQEAEAYQQQQMFMQQQQQQQQQQQEQMYQQQIQQQWLMQQQQQQQQQQPSPLQAQPTGFGTKNPFAPAMSPSPSIPPMPTSSTPQFNLQGTYANSTPSHQLSSPSTMSPPPMGGSPMNDPSGFRPNSAMQRKNEQNTALNNLFANKDDGMDTFGNMGALRYGHTDAGRVAYQKTGNNPFGMQQQPQQQQVNNDQPFFNL